jgi:hypothetical protein
LGNGERSRIAENVREEETCFKLWELHFGKYL